MANNFINKINVGNDIYSIAIPYGVCETSGSTAAKIVTCDNFALEAGVQIKVKFTYANTATNPTLNINSTGAKAITIYGTTAATTNWKAGSVVDFTYDGTSWIITGFGALQEGSVTVDDEELIVSPNVIPTPTASATGNISLTAVSGQPSTGYYIKAHGGNSATTGSPESGERATVTISAGYVSGDELTIASKATASAIANFTDKYYSIPTGICSVTGGDLSKGIASGGELSGGDLSGGDLSLGTATAPTITLSEVASASQDTNIDISKTDVGSKDTTNYPYYFKISGTSTGGGNTVTRAKIDRAEITRATFSQTVNRADIKDAHTAGYIPDKAATTVISNTSETVVLAGEVLNADSIVATSITATAADGSTTDYYVKLKSATLAASGTITNVNGSGNVNPGTITIANQASATVSGKTQITASPSTATTNINQYYIAVKATAAANNGQTFSVSGTDSSGASASVSAEGYAKNETATGSISGSGTATANVQTKDSAITYIPISSGTLSNSAASGVTYSELSGPSLNEQDYLYINAGWYPNSKISLSTLIPDDPGYENAGNSHILKNYEAYDTTGKKLLGTIENVSWSTDYYTTTNTGYGQINNALYTGDSTHYIKAGSATPSAAVVGSSSALTSPTAMNNQYFTVTPQASVDVPGWIASISDGSQLKYKVRDGAVTPGAAYATIGSAGTSPTSVTSQYFKITPNASVGTAGWINSISDGAAQNYTVRSASTFTMTGSAVTDIVTVGAASSGYYPISAKVKGAISASTSGWFSNSGAIQAGTATQVGKIAASSIERSGNTVSWSDGYTEAGYSTGDTTSVTRSGNILAWGTGWITTSSAEAIIDVDTASTLAGYLVAANAGIVYRYTGNSTTYSDRTYTKNNLYTYES